MRDPSRRVARAEMMNGNGTGVWVLAWLLAPCDPAKTGWKRRQKQAGAFGWLRQEKGRRG